MKICREFDDGRWEGGGSNNVSGGVDIAGSHEEPLPGNQSYGNMDRRRALGLETAPVKGQR